MVGLMEGYDEAIVRRETDGEYPFSVWYFRGEELLAVSAINHPKAYVIGTKLIKERKIVDKAKLRDIDVALSFGNLS
jgi:3-phenylpropionate/trans-cinnamate dioxygenase ferredoxin reductase subunit